jgi:hypothetical protein
MGGWWWWGGWRRWRWWWRWRCTIWKGPGRVAQHCVGRDETARHCGGGAGDRGWGSVRNGGEPTRFYSRSRCGKCSGMGKEDGVRPRNEGAASATRRLAYLCLGNMRVVKADQPNLMWLSFHLRAIQGGSGCTRIPKANFDRINKTTKT